MEHNFISISRYSDSVPHMCKKHSSTIFCKEILCAFEVHTKTQENQKGFIKKIITLNQYLQRNRGWQINFIIAC